MSNKELKGKRLLVLGGSLWKDAIKRFAFDNDVTIIAAGNNTNAGIFDICDESYCVNSTDAVAMKALITEKKIDGVYMGGSEAVITAACAYINELNMPCYCTSEQWELLQNKNNFKSLCIQHGLPVVPEYYCGSEDVDLDDAAFPVAVKPVDGSGSSGFSVCNNNEELKVSLKRARENSPTHCAIIEKFVRNDGVVVFYTVSNGTIVFSGIEDKYPVRHAKQGSYVGGLFILESKLEEEFRLLFEKRIQNLATSIGLKEGTFWIEVFHTDNDYYFNEVGYRYGGSASIYPVDYLFGVNQVAADIYYALTGSSMIYGHKSLFDNDVPRKKYYAVYPVHLRPGKIAAIKGLDIIASRDDVVKILTAKQLGDTIEDTGSFGQVYALIHIVFDEMDELADIIDLIDEKLLILDSIGENMLKTMLDTKLIRRGGKND